jgi:release factor glutamine methyltransferase
MSLLRDMPNPHLDARLLLLESASISDERFYSYPETFLSPAQEKRFYKLVSKRLSGFPIPYLTRRKEFWSISFSVSPGVVIPRPETELVVEKTLERVSAGSPLIADIGTGCGNIALSLAKELPIARILATDKSRKALKLARLNARRQSISSVVFARGNLFSPLKRLRLDRQCDFIVSNPPYISEEEWATLPREIKDHEPKKALVAGMTGLEAIEELVRGAPGYLKPGGYLLVEIGHSQKERVKSFFDSDSEWKEAIFFKDLNGIDRVAEAKRE